MLLDGREVSKLWQQGMDWEKTGIEVQIAERMGG